MKAKKPNPRVFERAAVAVDKMGRGCGGCCYAIDGHMKWNDEAGTPTPETVLFRRLFGRGKPRAQCWWTPFDYEVRVIALQLAACIARDNAL